MLILIYIILISLSVLTTKVKYKKLIYPNTIFSVLWCLAGIIAICNNSGLIRPSLPIHIYIIISVITFNIVYFIFVKKSQDTNDNTKNLQHINYNFIIVTSILAIILMSPNLITSLKILIASGWEFDAVRANYLALNLSGQFVYVFFTNNVPIAIFGVTSLIAATDLVNKKYRLLPFTILNILIGTITFGGRYLILNFVVFYVASYLIMKQYKKVKLRKSYILLGVIILLLITVSRGTSGLSLLDMGILYYVGSFSFLELIHANPSLYGLNGPPMYGYLTLGFIFEPIVLALKLFFGVNIDVPSYHFNVYAQTIVNIGDTVVVFYNNNTTMFYTFIRDFGEIGVVLGTIFIALIVCFVQNRYEKYGEVKSLYFLVFMYSVIVNGTMMYTLTSVSSSLFIILIILFSKSKRRRMG